MVKASTAQTEIPDRELLVFGDKTFKIRVPSGAKLTFGPFSPPTDKSAGYNRSDSDKRGTLRVYEGTNVIAVFSGVSGYRDSNLEYTEQVAKEEGATIWKSDRTGYQREEKVTRQTEWQDPLKEISDGKIKKGKKDRDTDTDF